jgi:hypothetical protein
MLAESLPEGSALTVLDIVLLAEVAHVRLDLVQVAVIYAGEQVMLDLHIQPSSEEEDEVVISGDIVRGENLMNEEVVRELFVRVWRQVIDLTRDHEANGEHIDWHYREQERLHSQTVQEEGNNVDNKEVEGETKTFIIGINVLVLGERHNSVECSIVQSLRHAVKQHTKWHSNKPSDKECNGLDLVGLLEADIRRVPYISGSVIQIRV